MEEIEIKEWVTLSDAALAYAGRKSACTVMESKADFGEERLKVFAGE